MRQYKSVMQNLDTADIEDSLASVVTRVSGNDARVVVEQHGKPVAAIISIEDLRRFAELEKEREDPWAVLDLARAAFADVPDEEIEAEFDRVIAEVRAQARAGTRLIRVTLDTNVLASGLTRDGSAAAATHSGSGVVTPSRW